MFSVETASKLHLKIAAGGVVGSKMRHGVCPVSGDRMHIARHADYGTLCCTDWMEPLQLGLAVETGLHFQDASLLAGKSIRLPDHILAAALR